MKRPIKREKNALANFSERKVFGNMSQRMLKVSKKQTKRPKQQKSVITSNKEVKFLNGEFLGHPFY